MELTKTDSQSVSYCPFCGMTSLEQVAERTWQCQSCSGMFRLPPSVCASLCDSLDQPSPAPPSPADEPSRRLLKDGHMVSETLLEKTLARQDCRMCLMILEAPIPVLLHTADGQMMALSRRFVEQTGYTLADIPDAHQWLRSACRVPEDCLEEAARQFHEKHALGETLPEERSIYLPSGEERLWKFYASRPLELFDGTVLTATMAVDVTEQRQSESQLEEANRRLCSLFTHAPVGMAIFEAREPYRIAAHNPAYLKIWPEAFHAEGIVGKNIIEFLAADEQERVRAVFREVIETGRPKLIREFFHVCPDHGGTWWNWNLTPVFENGEVIAFIHMLAEVTDTVRSKEEMTRLVETHTAELMRTKERLEKQIVRRERAQTILRRHMELHRKIIDNIPVMLMFYDQNGQFQLLNREFQKLTGWTAAKVKQVDNPMKAFFPDPTVRRKAWEFMLKASTDWKEFPITTCDGQAVDSLWTNVRLSDGSQIGIGLDMRQRLETERKLEALNRDLNRRAEQLQFLAGEVTEAEDRERRHLAELLHDDLQQMLVAAKYQLNFVREGIGGNEDLQKEIEELLRILNESISKTRGLSHELSPPALHQESLAKAMMVLAGQMKEKHGLEVTVEAKDDYKSPLDNIKSFLFKSVQEMLFNVIKHAGTNRATVSLWQKGFDFNVTVSDAGRGFDASERERWSNSQAGMGLFKVQERVKLMGGDFRIASAPGKGTSITLSVPVRPVPRRSRKVILDKPDNGQSRPAGRKPLKGGERKIRVVLADDHDVVRKGIAALLLKEGDIEIVGQASNGQQVIELAQQLHPDLILMDVAMPHLDGVEATRILQTEQPGIKIVALSMFDKRDMAEQMLKAGAMLYLNKSDAFEELLGAIRKIMGMDAGAIL